MNINIFINLANLGLPLAIVQPAYHGNMNMTAQQGIFTLWQTKKEIMINENKLEVNMEKKVDRRPLDVLLNDYFSTKGEEFVPFMYKITIANKFFEEIYRYLADMGHNAARIYPGYRGVAKAVEHDRFLVSEELRIS